MLKEHKELRHDIIPFHILLLPFMSVCLFICVKTTQFLAEIKTVSRYKLYCNMTFLS